MHWTHLHANPQNTQYALMCSFAHAQCTQIPKHMDKQLDEALDQQYPERIIYVMDEHVDDVLDYKADD